MSPDVLLAGIVAAWITVPAVPLTIERVEQWREKRLDEIRTAESQCAEVLDRAIAALRDRVQ